MNHLGKRICAALLAGAMTMALAACDQSETGTTGESAAGSSGESSEAAGEPVTVRFFNGNVEMVDWYNDAVERFNAESESVKVEHEFQKEGTSALQTKFAAGDIPDITTMGTQQMIDAGKFVDLTDSEWWDRIDPAVKEISVDNKSGKNYYLPTNTMMTGTIYNQKIFDELNLKPAKTLDEFTENLRAIKNAYPDKTPLFFSGKEAWTMGMLFGYIPGAAERQRLGELEKGKPVYVMCQSGLRSYIACRILEQHGFACYNFSGGYRMVEAARLGRCAAPEAFPCGQEKAQKV